MGNIQLRHKHVAPHGRRFKSVASRSRGAKVSDADEVDKDIRMDKNNHLPSPEADKVQGALKSTSMELHKAVKDPLPEALHLSETMAAGIGRDDTDSETAAENLSRGEVHVPSASIDNAAEEVIKNKENTTRDVCGTENTSSGQDNKSQNILPRFGLMDRNPTAQTHSWDDSIENTTDGSPDRPHLPSPKRVNMSPLKNYQVVKFMRRRKRKKWCPEEEETLRTGVKKYGIGNWKLILNVYRNIFEERTEVDLKDKWRNLTREGRHH
ncbi:hypothetical protein Nepgr_014899 [Nepenthes gracilis]|uniref:Uncharacterized protein n=1 Tax=Nepenthes gracilis TaxID=150966 RepID=A0AAD3SKY1_NEPGR|nr:hypothetical protein Nepgr_014899 [Nepenthes gracilis]